METRTDAPRTAYFDTSNETEHPLATLSDFDQLRVDYYADDLTATEYLVAAFKLKQAPQFNLPLAGALRCLASIERAKASGSVRSIEMLAGAIGVGRTTMQNWMKDVDNDKASPSKRAVVDVVTRERQAILSNFSDVAAPHLQRDASKVLSGMQPHEFSDKRVHKPNSVNVTLNAGELLRHVGAAVADRSDIFDVTPEPRQLDE